MTMFLIKRQGTSCEMVYNVVAWYGSLGNPLCQFEKRNPTINNFNCTRVPVFCAAFPCSGGISHLVAEGNV